MALLARIGATLACAFALACGAGAQPSLDAALVMDAAVGNDAPSNSDLAIDAGPNRRSAWSMGYYAGWEKDRLPVDAIDWGGLTELAIAFYLPHDDGSLDETLSSDATSGPALARALVAAAHAHGLKILASIGGADSGPSFEAATGASTETTFISNLVALYDKYGFDGLDIDWEPLSVSDQPAAIAIANQLRAARPGILMTMPIGAVNGNTPGDLSGFPAIAVAYQQLNVMTYGLSNRYPGWKSWHSSPMRYVDSATPASVDDSVSAYLGVGVPAAQLGIGIGFFGLCYTPPVRAPDQALGGATVFGDGYMSYANIMTSYYAASARKWDSLALVPYLSFAAATGPKGCTYISYDDPQSIAEKAKYLEAKGLGGVIEWTLNEGYVNGANPLADTIETTILTGAQSP